jgi:hypothetical protein
MTPRRAGAHVAVLGLAIALAVAASCVKAHQVAGDIDREAAAVLARRSAARRPSRFAAHFAVDDVAEQDKARAAAAQGAPENAIVRTAGSNCRQAPGSSVACDMCCDGRCCEDPQYWSTATTRAPGATFVNSVSWFPLRFAFVVPSTFSNSSIPSESTQRLLVSRVNDHYAAFPFRVLWAGSTVYRNDTLHANCPTDPCFTDANCGFLRLVVPAVTRDVDREIVVTVCPGLQYLGEAQFPWARSSMQYVQVQLENFAGPSLLHELGHYFGLFHVFEGTCSDKGDWVDDTPQGSAVSADCATPRDSCLQLPGSDDVTNFMNYGLRFECGLHFTSGQVARATAATLYYRPTLVGNTRVDLSFSSAAGETAPGCVRRAQTFADCWCRSRELDPFNWCRTPTTDGSTYTAAPSTPSPRASAHRPQSSAAVALSLAAATALALLALA